MTPDTWDDVRKGGNHPRRAEGAKAREPLIGEVQAVEVGKPRQGRDDMLLSSKWEEGGAKQSTCTQAGRGNSLTARMFRVRTQKDAIICCDQPMVGQYYAAGRSLYLALVVGVRLLSIGRPAGSSRRPPSCSHRFAWLLIEAFRRAHRRQERSE
jgi:hypothetical protein